MILPPCQYLNDSCYTALVKYSVQSLGDIDKDGFNDFSVTRPDIGNGYIIWGRDGKKTPFTDITFEGDISKQSKDWFKITDGISQIIGVGDINADGYADFAISKNSATHIMYGLRTGFHSFKPIDANPPFGFTISSPGRIYEVVPVGDVNNDKVDDFSIFLVQPNSGVSTPSLQIVFGDKGHINNFDLSKVPYGAGVKFTGNFGSCLTKTFGVSKKVCDYNKDGIADIAVSHYKALFAGQEFMDTHIVFGKDNLESLDLDTLNNADGVTISTLPQSLGSPSYLMTTCGDMNHRHLAISTDTYTRIFEFSDSWFPVVRMPSIVSSSANLYVADYTSSGDLNCDGFPDLLFSSVDSPDILYVVFGNKEGIPNFKLPNKVDYASFIKISMSLQKGATNLSEAKIIPDINGDGCDDLYSGIIYPDKVEVSTAAYIIWGNKDFAKSDIDISVMAPQQGFLISEVNPQPPASGGVSYSVNSVGDINKDGFNDFSVSRKDTNTSFVVWGRDTKKNPYTNIKLDPNAKSKFKVSDYFTAVNSSKVVAGGDINGDGFKDLLINSGYDVYVMYGKRAGFPDFIQEDARPPFGFKVLGGGPKIKEVVPVGDVNGDTFDDFAIVSYCTNQAVCQPIVNIIFGSESGVDLNLSNLSSTAGVKFTGDTNASAEFAFHIPNTSCDYNGDGISDIVVLHRGKDKGVNTCLVFGKKNITNLDLNTLGDANGLIIPTLPENKDSNSYVSNICGDFDHRFITISTFVHPDGTNPGMYTRIIGFRDPVVAENIAHGDL